MHGKPVESFIFVVVLLSFKAGYERPAQIYWNPSAPAFVRAAVNAIATDSFR